MKGRQQETMNTNGMDSLWDMMSNSQSRTQTQRVSCTHHKAVLISSGEQSTIRKVEMGNVSGRKGKSS